MPLKIDMHVHSVYSKDGLARPLELLKIAKSKGIGFAVTEHNHCDSFKEYEKLNKEFNVPIIFGEEKKVFFEEKLVGELLFYFLQEPIVSKELFEAIGEGKKQDAIISVAHPFDFVRKPVFFGFRKLEEVKSKIDAIEVFNSRAYLNSNNKKAEEFALQNNLAFTAGSDVHIPSELGHALTVCEADSLEGFRKSIKQKKTRFEGKLSSPIVHLYSSLKNFGLIK